MSERGRQPRTVWKAAFGGIAARLALRRLLPGAGRWLRPGGTVKLRGVIDAHNADHVSRLLTNTLDRSRSGLNIDMTQVPHLSRSGTKAFIQAARAARTTGATITVTGANPQVRGTLRGAGLDRLLDYHP